MKYEITKEIYEQIKNYIEDVKEEIDNINEENGRLFGFYDVVEVCLQKHLNFENQTIVYELKVNWSTLGALSVEDTKKFMQALNNAIEYVEKLNMQIAEKIESVNKEVCTMTKYYYIDECPREGDNPVQEYKDEQEFLEGLHWNNDVAKEYGDHVDEWEEIEKAFKENEDYYHEVNGAGFLKLTNKTLKDYGY